MVRILPELRPLLLMGTRILDYEEMHIPAKNIYFNIGSPY